MKYKKALGQNFFNNPNLAQKIVDIVIENKPKRIIEIGPGNGYFTSLFSKYCNDIVLIEKDIELIPSLSLKFPQAKIVNEDFLKINLSDYLADDTIIYGSLPYNVSKPIIKICAENSKVENMYFIVQKEVGLKYAQVKPSSMLYMLTKLYLDTKVIQDINPGSFIPRPKVISSFINMKRNNNIKLTDVEKFIQLVKLAYNNPRKTLKNNLSSIEIELGRFEKSRAEELSFDDFVSLVK